MEQALDDAKQTIRASADALLVFSGEMERLQREAEIERHDLLQKARTEAEQLLDGAGTEAKELLDGARTEAKELLNEAKTQVGVVSISG
jgi:vacuolar-type H+-ATPase subunit H